MEVKTMSKKLTPMEAVANVLLAYERAHQTLPGEVAEILANHVSTSRATIITQYQHLAENNEDHPEVLVTPPPTIL
jgi:hypothetical protein